MILEQLRQELATTEARILKVTPRDSHIDNLPFHLGRVGGSGRNVYRLNKRRERYLDRSIQAARILTALYEKRDNLKRRIADIESGKVERDQEKKQRDYSRLAQYWNGLKAGDKIDIGGNDPAVITKKNKKSIETGEGCKWTAAEIIGKQAAALL